MGNEIVSVNDGCSPLGSINKWFMPNVEEIDKTEEVYRKTHSSVLAEPVSVIVIRSNDDKLPGEVKNFVNSNRLTPDLAEARIELALKKISGATLNLMELRSLKYLNSLLSKELHAVHDTTHSEELRSISSELKDALAFLKK